MLKYYENQQNGWDVGVDEVGRGCLLGPVVACAVALPPPCEINKHVTMWSMVKDSKKVSPKKRKELYDFITGHCTAYGVGLVSNTIIDDINIFGATMKAMHSALDTCISRIIGVATSEHNNEPLPLHLYIDGPYFKPRYSVSFENQYLVHHHCVVNGDATYLSIAAASIVAKYVRDTYMENLVAQHPEIEIYSIFKNKGYGTKSHIEAIKLHGAHPLHRKSFKPISLMF